MSHKRTSRANITTGEVLEGAWFPKITAATSVLVLAVIFHLFLQPHAAKHGARHHALRAQGVPNYPSYTSSGPAKRE